MIKIAVDPRKQFHVMKVLTRKSLNTIVLTTDCSWKHDIAVFFQEKVGATVIGRKNEIKQKP